MPVKKRTKIQRESDLPLIAEMYKEGKLQVQIGQAFGISQGQVSYDIAEILRRWRADSAGFVTEAVEQELRKINSLEIVAWQEWDKSLADAITTTVETKTVTLKDVDPDGNLIGLPAIETKTTRRVTKQTGNTAYTDTVRWCIDRRCKLLGLDAPTKQEVSGANGSPLLVKIEYTDIDIDPAQAVGLATAGSERIETF
jgi:hypothetical protein